MFKQLLLGSALIAIGTPVEASLIVRDLRAPGDGLVTYDTVSGLEWLDLTETAGQSYNQVMVRTAVGGDLDGWAYSGFFPNSEIDDKRFSAVEDLYTQFGLIRGGSSYSQDRADKIGLLANYIGCPHYNSDDGVCGFWGIVKANFSISNPNPTNGGLAYAVTNSWTIRWENDDHSTSMADPVLASFLVRQAVVPIPAAAWLFGGALGLLGVLRRGG